MREPRRVRAFGVVLESGIPLPGLPDAGGAPPFLRFRLDPRLRAEPGLRFRAVVRGHGGAPWMLLARAGGLLLLRVPGLGLFSLSSDGREVRGAPSPGVDGGIFRRVLLDHVLPRALHLSGRTVFHASAVAGPRGALVFVGATGSGKSSLAALLASRGNRLLADDGARIDAAGGGARVVPAHAILRLREPLLRRLPRGLAQRAAPGPGTPRKWTLDARRRPLRFARGPAPLLRILLLEPVRAGRRGTEARFLTGRRAAVALLEGIFRSDPWDSRAFARDLDLVSRIVAAAPVSVLRVPAAPHLPQVEILDLLTDCLR